ncbi:MAG: response regulator [Patescibacteria group bacterium]
MAKVLVIDDSPLIRAILGDYLHDLGHVAYLAATAAEALSLCAEQRPDLVIKDLVMKDTDPDALMRDLRLGNSALPIVVCTTSGRRQEVCAAIRAGADDFLIKPFSRMDVLRLLERYANAG